jgi:hypothetical protein
VKRPNEPPLTRLTPPGPPGTVVAGAVPTLPGPPGTVVGGAVPTLPGPPGTVVAGAVPRHRARRALWLLVLSHATGHGELLCSSWVVARPPVSRVLSGPAARAVG